MPRRIFCTQLTTSERLFDGDYAGGHWLASFALLALTD